MTKLPSSRLLLSAAILSTVVIAGCDVDSGDSRPVADVTAGSPLIPAGPLCNLIDTVTGSCASILTPPDANDDGNPDYFIPGTHPRFTPATADLPLNTDLLFSGSTDGTAVISGSDTVRDAVNDLDGWSTNAYFDVAFANGQLDPATVNTSRVLLLPLESNGDALNPANIITAAPFDPVKVAATTYSVSVVSIDGGTNNAIRIKPTKPLLAKKKYLVVLTNGIKNASGAAITRSATYDLLASTAPLANAALAPLRSAVGGWEALAVGFLSAVAPPGTPAAALKSSLALTFTFTTTDPTTPLIGMAGPRAALFAGSGNNPALIPGINAADAGGLLSSPKARTVSFPAPTAGNAFDLCTLTPIVPTPAPPAEPCLLSANKATLYTGAITLPYYQTVTDGSTLTTPVSSTTVPALNSFWRGDNRLAAAPPAGLGLPVPTDSDGTYNTTYRFPFAKPTGSVTVPLQVTLPNPAHQPAGFPAACGAVAAGTGGYPVVIYVHGITSDRTSVMALAHSLASSACTATVAIDLPMHGLAPSNALWHYLSVDRADLTTVAAGNSTANERHFEIAQNAIGQAVAMNFGASTDGSGAWFINLATLANSRDNLRQAVMDLLNLNASLAAIDANQDGTPDLNTSKVTVVGVSLGGMVATTFTTVNQAVLANEAAVNAATGNAFPSRLNSIKGLVASVAGGQISRVLEHSPAFGPKILGGLRGAGAVPGTSNYEKFMYVTQSMIDSGDPINFAPTLRALGVPVLVQEIVGGGITGADGTYAADAVVPNNANAPLTQNYTYLTFPGGVPTPNAASYTADTAPLAGTDPLLTLLGITNTGTVPGVLDMTTNRGAAARLSIGYHSSLLTPNAGASPSSGNLLATGEMQTQVVSFVVNTTTTAPVPALQQTAFGTAGSGAAAGFVSLLTR